MDWHSILETGFQILFFVGLVMTVLMGLLSGAFHHEIASGSSFEGGVAHDLGGPHVERAAPHAGHAEVGWSSGEMPGFSPWSPTVIFAALTGAGGLGWLSLRAWDMSVPASIVVAGLGGLLIGGASFGLLA